MLEELRKYVDDGVIRPLDWHFARWVSDGDDPELKYVALTAAIVSRHLGDGNICIDLRDYAGQSRIDLNGTERDFIPLPDLTTWIEELKKSKAVMTEDLCQVPGSQDGSSTEIKPLVLCGSRVYIGRYWFFEVELAKALKNRVARQFPVDEKRLREILDRLFPPAEQRAPDDSGARPLGQVLDWQKVAVATAVMRHFTLISGGPGTGKTYTVAAILIALNELLTDRDLRIGLAAPTGKAAARITESLKNAFSRLPFERKVADRIPKEALTLHRLIGIREGRSVPRYGPDNPLPLDVLIVDEASMIDLPMMYRVVAALPDNARLVLLGDKDQLASVEAGNVFAELCGRSRIPHYGLKWAKKIERVTGIRLPNAVEGGGAGLEECTVFLHRNYRFSKDSPIGRLANAVRDNHGVMELLESHTVKEKCDGGEVRYSEFLSFRPFKPEKFWTELTKILRSTALEWFGDIFNCKTPEEALALFEKSRILCVHREGPFGVKRINRLIEEILINEHSIRPFMNHYRGRPVLVTRNDYVVKLMNGDVGIIWPDENSGRLLGWFRQPDGTIKSVRTTKLPEHETAFAMTVHKAQGSEFDNILFILPPEDNQIITRELFYTAITRARCYVEICGTKSIIERAVKRPTRRRSGLYERITT